MIYVVTHKQIDETFFDKDLYSVINIGNNPLSKTYCELTALKEICERPVGEKDNILGLIHYRRYFEGEQYKLLTRNEMEQILSSYDCIIPERMQFNISVRAQFELCHGSQLLGIMDEILTETYPDLAGCYDSVLSQNKLHPCNMFISRLEFAVRYWNWVKPMLEKAEEKMREQGMDMARNTGYIGERLFNVYLASIQAKTKELPVRFVNSFKSEFVNSQYSENKDDLLNLFPSDSVLLIDETTNLQEMTLTYDYIVVRNRIEREENPQNFLKSVRNLLSENGVLLLLTENRLALKNFLGEKDPFTHTVGDNLEGYRRKFSKSGRCYSKAEMERILLESGLKNRQIFSVLPNIDTPKFIIAEGYRPKELMSARYFPEYSSPDTVFLNEEYVLDGVIENDMLPAMANGLLFVCSEKEVKNEILEAVISQDRSDIHRIVTLIKNNHSIEKVPLNDSARFHLQNLVDNHAYLRSKGLSTVEDSFDGHIYRCREIQGETSNIFLKKLFFEDREKFIEALDLFRDCIFKSSEHVYISDTADNNNPILERGFADLVPINAIYNNGNFVFFDQEFFYEKYPANAMLLRTIHIIYDTDNKIETIMPKKVLFDRYGLTPYLQERYQQCFDFTYDLRNEAILKNQIESVRTRPAILEENRWRMNISQKMFEQVYWNPLAGLENKKLVAFGESTRKFVDMYEDDYDIVLDTEDMNALKQVEGESVRIIICSENPDSIYETLQRAGYTDTCIYRENNVYPGRQASVAHVKGSPKPYHIGYIAGVFDLYHIGHLNMFKRAKELCDYLIVGVVTDEGVRDFKGTEVYIPFCERVEMIKSCAYVDEVVRIPYYFRGTIEAFEKYHFDVQFSGSDYETNPLWLEHKRYLESHGAEMVFFPYTQSTSSSKIKRLIEKDLL